MGWVVLDILSQRSERYKQRLAAIARSTRCCVLRTQRHLPLFHHFLVVMFRLSLLVTL